MATSYHGPTPVTPSDKKMANQHLTATKQLLLSKIKDHQQAKTATNNPKSKSYNQSHLVSHKKELKGVNRSLQTLKGGNMSTPLKKTGTTDGKPNQLGGGGRFQQLVNQGKSPALAAYIGRKKYGAKTMASMAVKGK